MNGKGSNPEPRFPRIHPARKINAPNTNHHEPIPLRSLSAARSPIVS